MPRNSKSLVLSDPLQLVIARAGSEVAVLYSRGFMPFLPELRKMLGMFVKSVIQASASSSFLITLLLRTV